MEFDKVWECCKMKKNNKLSLASKRHLDLFFPPMPAWPHPCWHVPNICPFHQIIIWVVSSFSSWVCSKNQGWKNLHTQPWMATHVSGLVGFYWLPSVASRFIDWPPVLEKRVGGELKQPHCPGQGRAERGEGCLSQSPERGRENGVSTIKQGGRKRQKNKIRRIFHK